MNGDEGINTTTTQPAPISDDKIVQLLNAKFPGQGFEGQVPPGLEKQILTYRTVYELASQGKFEEIRPDVLVPHFSELLEIHRYYVATYCDPRIQSSSQQTGQE